MAAEPAEGYHREGRQEETDAHLHAVYAHDGASQVIGVDYSELKKELRLLFFICRLEGAVEKLKDIGATDKMAGVCFLCAGHFARD